MADFPSVQGGADPTSRCWRMAGASAVELFQGELGKWNQLPAFGYPSSSRCRWRGRSFAQDVLPFGRRDLQLFPSCSASVVGIDADGGSPYGDFTKECGGQMAPRWCPDGLFAAVAGAVSNLICKADYELRPLRQVLAPNVMIMKR
jgi:hypothetical protein